jgi:broad specificity phosphatase PhoE
MTGLLYLVRHGEAEGNQGHRYIGWSDPPLTELGQAQALCLAERLKAEPIRRVIASDRQRATATAAPIAAALGLPVETDPDLRELHFGRWEGRRPDELWAEERNIYEAWLNNLVISPPGGESLDRLQARIARALGRAGEGALLVTHGGPIRLLLAAWTGEGLWGRPVPPGSAWRLAAGAVAALGTAGWSMA